jgi:hypothetical protein
VIKPPMVSVYEIVTERIIQKLDQGVTPWRRPWHVESGLPRNLVSGKEYRGVNNKMMIPRVESAAISSWTRRVHRMRSPAPVRSSKKGFAHRAGSPSGISSVNYSAKVLTPPH